MSMLGPLEPVAPNLWCAWRPQRFYGLPVGTRMTVICLHGGRLLLHSPVELDDELRAAIDAIGEVCYVVAPNKLHHLYAGKVAEHYPAARLWIAPGLETKRPDLRHEAILGDDAPVEWRDEVEQVFVAGRPFENEVVFFHRESRTLIVSDLAFNFGPSAAAPTRLVMRAIRSYGRLGPTTLDGLLVRDREAARASLRRILAWDFDRVIVAHGDVQQSGGHALLERGYRWLLR